MPVIDDKTQLSVDDLKTIVHGLKMASFNFVEDDAMDEIKLMIKALPSSEKIEQMIQFPKAIKNLQTTIGNIMRLIELYGKRDVEYKVRYRSRTNLPPRYKVLEWRDNMKANATEMTRELVRLSSLADEKGHGEESAKLLKCAKKIIDNKIEEKDIEEVVVALNNVGMGKEAQAWEKMKGFFGGMGQGVKDVFSNIWQSGKAGGLEAQYIAIVQHLEKFKAQVVALANQQGVSDQIKQRMQALSQAITISEGQMGQAAEEVKRADAVPQNAQAPAVAQAPAPADLSQTVASFQNALKIPGLDKYQVNAIIQALKALQRTGPAPAVPAAGAAVPAVSGASTKYNLKTYKLAHRK